MTKTERMTEAEAITAWNTRLTDERIAELETDVRIWKGEAQNRSEGMVQLNLDRAAMGVEIYKLKERIAELEIALRQIANRQFHCQHCTASINMRHIARAALKEQP
jgi:hypothetical protein